MIFFCVYFVLDYLKIEHPVHSRLLITVIEYCLFRYQVIGSTHLCLQTRQPLFDFAKYDDRLFGEKRKPRFPICLTYGFSLQTY